MNKTCKTCIDNDDGLCDRKGILVEDEDHCDRYRETTKPRMKKHEKKLDITPELALAAYNTLVQFCRGQPASEDGTCSNCILYQHCPGATDLLPEDWTTLRYPYLEGNTIYYLRDGEVQQNVFARRRTSGGACRSTELYRCRCLQEIHGNRQKSVPDCS